MTDGWVVTVTGEMRASELGATLAHEHLYCDISAFSGKTDNRVTVPDQVAKELAWFHAAGGKSIIEVTPEGIGRDPLKLRDISLASGVPVVSGISFYAEETYPPWVRDASREQIADYFVRELEEGQEGVRAGVIGELTSHNEPLPRPRDYRLHELERRVFEAAALAQQRTG